MLEEGYSPPTPLPTKFTRKARQDAICEALRRGSTRSAAIALVGCDYSTFMQWLRFMPQFAKAVIQAEAEAQQVYEEAVLKAVKGYEVVTVKETVTNTGFSTVTERKQEWHPDIAKFWLERRRRADYGPEINLRAIPSETLRELLPESSVNEPLPSLGDTNVVDGEFAPDPSQ